MAALAGSVVWARAPRHLLVSTSSQLPPVVARPQKGARFSNCSLRIRLNATSQDKTVSGTESSETETQQKEEEQQGDESEQQDDESRSESSSGAGEKPLDPSAEAKAKEIGDALRQLREKKQEQNILVTFWNGLLEEIGLIEWPTFGKVFGTTLVVLSIIIGSSVVLLTVNFLLAELADLVFKAKTAQ